MSSTLNASKSDVGSSAYTYDTVHKHAVKTAGTWSMTYDANGNMTSRAGGAIAWKSYNLPATIAYQSSSTQFWYNANHQRWKQVANYAGTTETTHYIGGLLEVMTRGSGPTEYRHQIPAGTGTAVYTRRTDGTSGTYYATSDHLGSSDLVMDSTANVLARESFTPFGARRGSNWQGLPTASDYTAFGNTTRKGFTGHEMLDSVNLVHMNGRVYDPYLGRVLSADTVIQSLGASESINPYAYAWNDPLRYTDPSGHSLFGDILGILAAAVVVFFAPELGLPAITSAEGALTAAVAGFVGGFVGAAISTGSLSAALTAGLLGAVVGAAFFGAGSFAQWASDGSKVWLYADGLLAHATVGCGAAMLSGGNCGRGAISAAVAEAAGPLEKSTAEWGGPGAGIAAAGIVGGATARAVGGSFSEGFSVAAAGYLFNEVGHKIKAYLTEDAAAKAALQIANPQSIADNREFGGLTYEDSSGKYGYTGPIEGEARQIDPFDAPAPAGTTVVGSYHTHGDYSISDGHGGVVRTSDPGNDRFDSDNFGNDDEVNAQHYQATMYSGWKSYLGTPSGVFKVFDPATGTVSILK